MVKQALIKQLLLIILLLLINNQTIYSQNTKLYSDLEIHDLKSHIDSIVASEMDKFNIPGLIVTVINDSLFEYTKEFGYSNLKTNTKVNPENTGFRIASLTKTFTALSVLQLVY
nr:serine hydrolase domain-containing protein [uncultured Psychroserpens sp.]